MGKRGTKQTPTAILKLRGSWRANIRKDEPQPEPGRPECLAMLGERARELWDYYSDQLEKMGVLTMIDEGVLYQYCATREMYEKCYERIVKGGMDLPIKDAGGKIIDYKDRPEISRFIRLGEKLMRLAQKLGLSPSDRVGLSVEQLKASRNETESQKERLLRIS